uniref:Uncharacterized protein n=1 Tax=Ditylenchus dipsaci TaxID=166011 RepID=A0A915E4A3_9BILA
MATHCGFRFMKHQRSGDGSKQYWKYDKAYGGNGANSFRTTQYILTIMNWIRWLSQWARSSYSITNSNLLRLLWPESFIKRRTQTSETSQNQTSDTSSGSSSSRRCRNFCSKSSPHNWYWWLEQFLLGDSGAEVEEYER